MLEVMEDLKHCKDEYLRHEDKQFIIKSTMVVHRICKITKTSLVNYVSM